MDASGICIAGKGDIATQCLRWVVESGWPKEQLKVLCNSDDGGRHHWQYSLRASARELGIGEVSLGEVERMEGLLFLSLEFDRLIKPVRFKSDRLFNIHFSKLPEYRGAHTAVWPILDGKDEAGVTLHRIDPGIDTGEVIDQDCFELPLDWTSRDLYQAFMDHGTEVVIRHLPDLIAGRETGRPQNAVGASFHSRKEIDFGNLNVVYKKTAFQVHNFLRAFSFFEYQLPRAFGREVIGSMISDDSSVLPPGTLQETFRWTAAVSTLDYELHLVFNVYDELFRWARDGGDAPEDGCLLMVPDIDRTQRNGWNGLMMAAWAGNIEAMEGLLDLGADSCFFNRRGTTPLMYAAGHAEATGNTRPLELLLERGARVEQRDTAGLSVVEHLKSRGSHSLARLIECR